MPATATARVDAALRAALAELAAGGLGPGTTALVGVSGGQDSLCLVHALCRLQALHGWSLRAACVDHGLRAASAAEAEHVARLLRAWGVPVHVTRVDVPTYRRRERLNVQQAARYARYQALAGDALAVGAAAVAVGHTADDVAETLLLHLLRGAGLDGLAALPLWQALPRAALGPPLDARPLPDALSVLRPLLAVARADTAAYCAEHGLAPMGEAGPYRRDRLRAELLPQLERYNPAARQALARAARALGEERAALEQVVDQLWASHARPEGDALAFGVDTWEAVPPALRKRLLRRGMVVLAGSDAGLSARTLAAALGLARAQPGRGLDLPGGLRLTREPGALRLARRGEAVVAPAEPLPLPVPGRVLLPGVGIIAASRGAAAPARWPAATAAECWLDAAAVGERLLVRWRRPGDRFQPLGMTASKRLQDFLVDAHVPREARARLPLVVADRGIAWVVGQRIADWARARPESEALLHLTFEPPTEAGEERS
jgi:tRNA(Ile)-lysidine synthetase-like protein